MAELEFGVLVFVERGKPRENPQSKVENQQQTQPTCDARSANRAWATAVGGEYSNHCTINFKFKYKNPTVVRDHSNES